jgi:hypothetical protein
MTERVRIVIEATLTGQELDWVLTDHGRYNVGHFGVIQIEAIEPPFVLPTKRWAQVADGMHSFWTYSGPGEWRNFDGDRLGVRELLQRPGLRVISDGVDE